MHYDPASCVLRAADSAPKTQILEHICSFIDSDEFSVPKATFMHLFIASTHVSFQFSFAE